MNQGQAGGAGIAAHLHQHVVPRWNGDANFFPIIAHTKAIPVVLGDTLRLMKQGWEEID
jgi:ATP adenylyltransferase